MLDEPFATGNSRLHRMDPRCKLVAATVFAVTTSLLHTTHTALYSLVIACLIALAAKLPARRLVIRLAFVNLFILFLWLFLPFSTPGTALFALGPLTATDQGIQLATLITIKSNAILLAFIALATTHTITECGQALAALRVPQKLALLFLFTWRYVHVIAQEYRRLATAAKIRGFVPKTSMHTYRTYANMAGMVLIKSWDRAERVDSAMRLRGFTGTYRTLTAPPTACQDKGFTLGLSFLLISMLTYDYWPQLLQLLQL